VGSLVCTGIPVVSHWDVKEKTLVTSAQTINEASVHAYNLKSVCSSARPEFSVWSGGVPGSNPGALTNCAPSLPKQTSLDSRQDG
jgi:hypothetical protein